MSSGGPVKWIGRMLVSVEMGLQWAMDDWLLAAVCHLPESALEEKRALVDQWERLLAEDMMLRHVVEKTEGDDDA